MGSSIEDVAFLARSAHRVGVLAELAEGSCDRETLREATGASDPTVGRILGDFESRGWSVRVGREYELTRTGAYVAEHFAELLAKMDVERKLRDVWTWLPGELEGFTVGTLADAVVTTVGPGDPYGPATRCGSLFREAKWVRGFDAGLTAPHHFEALYQLIVDGMDAEMILPADVSARIRETYPEKAAAVRESDHFTLWCTDALPLYRLTIFDHRVGVGGYDPDSGVLQVYADTDSEEARTWAEATFESFRRESRLVASARSTA
ncbi:MAG: helix-turn-helix transcriptional regulator [Salinigranum sp.]